MRVATVIMALLLWMFCSGFTGTLLKNDGSGWEGITVELSNAYTGSQISSTTTASDGTYTITLPESGLAKLSFKTSVGTRVRPDITLHVDAIRSLGSAGATLSAATLDSVASLGSASSVRASKVWGHSIKTQAEMVPPLTIRFDDYGAGGDDRYTGDDSWQDMITYTMEQGLIPCIATNTYLINQGGADADSVALGAIALKADETGIRPEWLIHTNTNMAPGAYGEPIWSPGQWDQFYAWSRDSWVKELNPEPLRQRINAIAEAAGANYRVQPGEIIGVVWPGDPSPTRRAWARRQKGLFSSVFDEVGLEWGIDGYSTTSDSLPGFVGSHAWSGGGSTLYNNAGWTLGLFDGMQADKALLPFPVTTDLGNRVIERGAQAKVPWAPTSTVEWTLAQNTNFSGSGSFPPTGYTDATVSNFSKTVRSDYLWASAYNGTWSFVLHPRGPNQTTDYSFSYPSSGNTNASLTVGDPVNGGASTFTDPFDWKYLVHLIKELCDAGFFRNTNMSEQVRWLASSPGRPGLRVRGTVDPVHVAEAIGDTVGVVPGHLLVGVGSRGNLSASASLAGTAFQKSEDSDFNGKWESWGVGSPGWSDVADPTAKLYLAQGLGNGSDPLWSTQPNNALCMWDDNGLNAQVWLGFDNLPPGQYILETSWQQAQRIDYVSAVPQLLMSGLSEINRTDGSDEHGLSLYEYLAIYEMALGQDTDSFTPADFRASPYRVGTTGFGSDTWPGAEPTVREAGWYIHRLSFNVPEEPRSSSFTPSTNLTHAAARRWRGHMQVVLSPLAEDYSGGDGSEEHPRLLSWALYWLGD